MLRIRLLLIFTLSICHPAYAEFSYEGQGLLRFPTGTEVIFNFGFAFQQSGYNNVFTAGEQQMEVTQRPEKYSIWLSMNQNHEVYVQEFATSYFREFEWTLGEHKIALQKKVLSPKRSIGDYVLTIDNISYFFKGKQGSVDILFDDEGIASIEANGFVKDLGLSE
ncbi:hypothetical protein [Planctobacterium marinum]|uniref:hypothetical protein n=1 Tax=Planctobacterium marinum TaxID=1631968 RepID=UPI001E39E2DD|nr:hypothetical protein [Planctobacterium marinum]MCC2604588.1 hypothetical protein [Planctobacterium marinum]